MRQRFSLSFSAASSRGASTRLRRLLEVDEDGELLLEDLRGVRDGVVRADRAVGPHLERELVVVGLLTDARVGDGVVHLADRREQRVDRDRADRHGRRLVALGRHVAAARRDRELHARACRLLRQRRDEVVRVEARDAVDERDVARGDGALALLVDADACRSCRARP